MTLNQKIWARTLLSSYNYLERMCDSLDRQVKNTAVNSYYLNYSSFKGSSIIGISNRIISLSNRKIDYINLKVIIEKALSNMPSEQAKLLIFKFIHKFSADKCAVILSSNRRTIYRRIDKALANFFKALEILGYDIFRLEKIYRNDKFIGSIFELLDKTKYVLEEKADVLSNGNMFDTYINELIIKAANC